MTNAEEIKFFGAIYGTIRNFDHFLNYAKKLEKEGLWLLVIPCHLIISDLQILHAVNLALRDFVLGQNTAKKISIQVLLRLLGESQISEAIKIVHPRANMIACVLIFYSGEINNRLQSLISELENLGLITGITKKRICAPNIEKIKRIYDISEEEIRACIRRRDEKPLELIEKIILEKIALTFL